MAITYTTTSVEHSLSKLFKIYLQIHCGEECLSTIALIILHCDVKLNYSKVVQDFLCSKQCHQLLLPMKLFLK